MSESLWINPMLSASPSCVWPCLQFASWGSTAKHVASDDSFPRTNIIFPMEVGFLEIVRINVWKHWRQLFAGTLGTAQHLNICKPGIPIVWILTTPYHIHTHTHTNTITHSTSQNTVLIVARLVLFIFGFTITISILRISLTALVFPTCASGYCWPQFRKWVYMDV